MARHYLINGVKVPFTAEQEAWRDAQEIQAAKDLAAEKYKADRKLNGTKRYPNLSEQLDQLFRDVAAGKFGEDAKTGEWYTTIKEVKDTYPKP
jgi:hypothetical protein|tara:strand:+ start:229 stop:507 length:279 start_codon:yes stop_codon:yes gene_type:complete